MIQARKQPHIPAYSLKSFRSDKQIIKDLLSSDPMYYVDHPEFHKKQSRVEKKLFSAVIMLDDLDQIWNAIFANYHCGRTKWENVIVNKITLTKQEEVALFLQYNYARWRVYRLQSAKKTLGPAEKRRMLKWYKVSEHCRKLLILANLGLVSSMVNKYFDSEREFSIEHGDIISEGYHGLMRAVEKFNVKYGWKLSTYACAAIKKAIFRLYNNTHKYNSRNIQPPAIDGEEIELFIPYEEDLNLAIEIEDLNQALKENRARLTKTELKILSHRFPMDPSKGRKTLQEVGDILKVSKERVRQVQNVALEKLKSVLEPVEEGKQVENKMI